MSVIASTSPRSRTSLLSSIALGGTVIFVLQMIHSWLVYTLLQNNTFSSVLQYMASGAMGDAAFTGGITTALLGLFFHLIVSFVIAGVFILSADRISLLRRNAIVGSLLYGIGVFIVMNMIVLPLSAAPQLPPPALPWLIEAILEHILIVGLSLGIIVRR